ncbi:carboxypeptidase C [Pichia kluyveri]|uniref:Carboxypeptidase n=1 Tax=Pichia kluyveri TaxID=36015 RepID=A0AAV5R2M3_PICKL|nr:carboxypeptidase C [Pichia kluyveri]
MRLTSTLAISLCASLTSVNAGVISPDANFKQQLQNPLNLDGAFDKIGDKINDKLPDSIKKAKSVLEKAALVTGQKIEELDNSIIEAWSEMELKFPNTVQNLQFSSEPQFKISKKPDNFWDFHVANTDKFPDYKMRVKKTNPGELGIDHTKQYSGYLDVESEDKHFFYWFFESRNDPKNDPVVLWLNGGPGCSSLTGLFFELGSSAIDENLNPVYNPYSWNSNASVIFLDQPVNVGYSYSSGSVSDTVAAGKDVYAFLELFFQQFPEYNGLDFHIAAESYGGHYVPVFASEILSHADRSFNLTSVLIGNGLTDPLTQYPEYEVMACNGEESGYKPVLDEAECEGMLANLPRCLSFIESCYESQSVFSCVPASIYCNNGQIGPYQKTGRNVYDVRKMCEGSSLCYKGLEYIDKYLNQDVVKEKLGAEVDTYESCNFDVNRNFLFAGDWMKPYHKNVIDLLEKELPVLIYAGDKDFICNWLGNKAWTNALEWSGKEDFSNAKTEKMFSDDGKTQIGQVKNFDYFTFARMFDGGHMVPYDQPEASLAMLNRWLAGDYKLGTK